MAKIEKLKKEGVTTYPVTVGDAVLMGNGKKLPDQLTELESKAELEEMPMENYTLSVYAEDSIVNKNGEVTSGYNNYRVYKLSGSAVEKRNKIYISNLRCEIIGSYAVFYFDGNNVLLKKDIYMIDTTTRTEAKYICIDFEDVVNVSYILINSNSSDNCKILGLKFEGDKNIFPYINDLKGKYTELEYNGFVEESLNYTLTLFAENSAIASRGAIIEMNGYNIYKIQSPSSTLLLRRLQTDLLGVYLINEYSDSNKWIGGRYMVDNINIARYGFCDVEYIPSDNCSYALIVVKGTDMPSIKKYVYKTETNTQELLSEIKNNQVYKTTTDYSLELYKEGGFISKDGSFVADTGYKVYKLSGNVVDEKSNISIKNFLCYGQGIYLATIYNENGNIINKQALLDNETLIGGDNDILIDLSIIASKPSYILLNYIASKELTNIEVFRYGSNPKSEALKSLEGLTNNLSEVESNKKTSEYAWELFAENKLIMADGSISEADYSGFNVYKLSGNIVSQQKKILLNQLYNNGLGIWLVGIYNSVGELIDTTGFILDKYGISRGYNDIVVDLSIDSRFSQTSYILVCISEHTLPTVAVDRYNNNAQMYADVLKKRFDGLGVGKTITVKKNGVVGSDCDYTTIKEAIDFANENKNTKIVVCKGTYDIIEEFGDDYMSAIVETDNNYKGLILGNSIKIIGQGYGVKLTAHYQGDNEFAKGKFSIFNIASDFHIENLELEATNVRYCVHEDNLLGRNDYNGVYRNIKMTHYGTNGTYYKSVCCLGAGTAGNTVTLLDGCEFNNAFDGNSNPVSYHNNYVNGEIAKVIVKNCYFHGSQTFQTWVYQSTGSEIECYLCGNKFGAPVSYLGGVGDLVRSKEFNNEIKETDD